MDYTPIIIAAIFAVVIIVALFVHKKIKANVGDFGIQASTETPTSDPAVKIKDAVTNEGGIEATDETGKGSTIERVRAQKDIKASSKLSQQNNSPNA